MKKALLGSFTVAACSVGALIGAAPANALYFNSDSFQFDFSGDRSRVQVDATNGIGLDFFNSSITGADNFTEDARVELTGVSDINGNAAVQFFDFTGSVGTIKDVLFTDNGLSEFINIELKENNGTGSSSGTNLIFDLSEAVALASINPVRAQLNGILRLVDSSGTTQRSANALLTTQISENGNSSFSITAVPTPAAVLPALIGMGTAAFRKKKHEEEKDLVVADETLS